MADFRSRLDPTEPCGICGRPRQQHWGRRSVLAPQKLGHQWRPIEHQSRKESPTQ